MRGGPMRHGEAMLVLGSVALALLVWLAWGCTIHLHLHERYELSSPTSRPADDNALTPEYLAERLEAIGVRP